MNWLRRNPVFYTALGLLVLAVLVGMWRVSELKERLADLKVEYARKSDQYERFLAREPAPTEANLEALDRNYARLHKAFSRLRAHLNLSTFDPELFFGEPPETATDAFFQIARYVEETRTLAADNQVECSPDKRFGFGAYANVGPKPGHIEPVSKQVKILSFAIPALLESGIAELVNVQRQPLESPDRDRAAASPTEGDHVQLPPLLGREQESFREIGFRVAFKGQSSSLRNFLNRLANATLPLVVREVEVENFRTEEIRANRRPALRDNPFSEPALDASALRAAQVPIISENESLFVVAFCFIEQIGEAPEPETEVADAPAAPKKEPDNA